ncbi:winged helix-turn-helix domain-containing protein [Bradyrhizobium sp. 170]|uniref:ATP-binding protein n=1 Tax=Bradyrhizobium sp. 170 TaxID=2782641 RepID=UPI001FFE90E7|nr:winged helix-turn-helix domain-containing protein [Bradyrhizobium sp. 170]UPK07172.1 winged helix-turn-helix domain-containing protein [Bradyrhizobium sp. 170]
MDGDSVHKEMKFGPFELSVSERVLRRDGVVLPLGSRALDILIYLSEHPGEVISKQQLLDHVWPDVTVEEGSLRVHVAGIRKVLGDGKFGNRYIANIQGRGYSFVGTVAGVDDGAADTAPRRYQGAIPPRLRRMVGREPVLSDVMDNLRVERFVTLLGPGGIGKTTIAVAAGHAVAEEFGGDVYFVDLGSLSDSDHVVRAIGTSLGLVLKSNAASVELIDLIRSRKLLIILDNCEHVIEAVASVAEQLFQEAGQVHLLATSRELLRVEGEHCYRVLPLDFPPADAEQTADAVLRYPAVQLFIERVTARGGNFVLTDREAPLVADMCRRLDGLPLAIELAAGPVAALGVRGTVARLVSRLELLKLGHRTAVPRHQTFKATLDWSYDLLTGAERIVFRRIARFVEQFSLEGARHVAGEKGSDDGEICNAIAGLVEKSLICTQLDHGEPQHRLLDTTRAYALEKLEEHDEFNAISLRHAEYVTRQLESQKEMLSALPRAERVAAYSSQLGNVRSALEWSFGLHGNDEIATRLAAASTQLFMELSLLIEYQSWAEQAIARLGDQHKNTRREMEICASLPLALMHTEGSNPHVRSAFSRALDVVVVQQDLAYELRLLSGLFMYLRWTTDIPGALDIAIRSQKVALKTQDPGDMALAEAMLGAANHLAGNHLVAQKHFEAGLRHSASGWRLRDGHHLFHHTSLLLVGLARSLLYRGQLDQSLDYARLAIAEGEKSGHPATLCRSLSLIIPIYLALEDWQRSEQHIGQLTVLSAAHSLKPYRAVATGLRGRWLLLQANIRDGVPLLKSALEKLEAQRHEMLNMDFVCDLGAGLAALGQHGEALALVVNALDVQKRGGKFLYVPALFRVKGLILASRSAEDYPEAEKSLLSSIEWARRHSATLFELKSAIDLAELLLSQKRTAVAYKHISAALNRTSDGIVSPVHDRARQILSRFQSGAMAAG